MIVSRLRLRPLAAAAKRRKGFALPLTILVIAALTATLAAAFSSVTAEIATNSAQRSESRAFALAESGLEEYIARRAFHCTARMGYVSGTNFLCSATPTDSEFVTVSLQGGYATVTAKRVQKGMGVTRPTLFLVRSRGVDTVAPFNGATRAVYGERIVAQYVSWNMNSVQVLSGWTSLSGLLKTGASGTLGGADHCPASAGGGSAPIAGVSLPTGTMTGSGAGVPTGNPGVLGLGTQAQADSAVKIDWNGIVNGGAVSADYTFDVNAAVPAALTALFADTTQYPVIHVTGSGSFNIPAGRGLLIIDGDGYMGHGGWNGIIMSGGNITSNGVVSVYGAIISGLNMKLTAAQLTAAGQVTPAGGDVGHGVKDIEYDSCQIAKAASRFGFFKVIPNAWMDNFTTY